MDIISYKKIRHEIAEPDLLKFINIPGVEPVFADDEAENFFSEAKELGRPLDHGNKTNMKLFFELKDELIQNYEKSGMGFQHFFDSKW